VYFNNADMQRELAYATSWGVSTRLLGAMIMTHSDDRGLVLPPNCAPIQVAFIIHFLSQCLLIIQYD
jgi:prolyl-tRNA synthetase